jgi:hypothetical protein
MPLENPAFIASNYPSLLTIVIGVAIVVFVIVVRWVHRDAKKHGSNTPWLWGIGVGVLFLLGIVPGLFGVIVYLLARKNVE